MFIFPGNLKLRGNFVFQLYSFQNGSQAPPSTNITIKYRRGVYKYVDNAGGECEMEPNVTPSSLADSLIVKGGDTCPLSVGEKLTFNATGFTNSIGSFYDRNCK